MVDGTASAVVLRTRVDLIDAADAARRVSGWAKQESGRMVCATNVHMVMEAWDDPGFAAVVNAADLVVADGR
jgi:N-acetylglucosaminyldiphosphoundecaprenol N-acetyl-beta-D-mannosaminyltransferase